MNAQAVRSEAAEGGRGRGRRLWRWLRIAIRVVIILILIPVVLVPVYTVVPPISTLMIYSRLFGPVERQWVPFDDIPQVLVASVIMSEDARFCTHDGVDWEELHKVMDQPEGPNRGASTVTMQTVKNLFLWNARSYVRKGLEIPLALYANLVWSKRRTMEIYLNIVEWGPGIFGVEAAAQKYFKRPAKSLTGGEAGLLVAALPNPITRNPGRPSRMVRARAQEIASRARAAGPYVDCLYP